MSSELYYWCNLQRENNHTSGYIEERGAKVGSKVELVDLDGEFWEVMSVSENSVTKDFVRNQERAFKQFQASTKGGGIDV